MTIKTNAEQMKDKAQEANTLLAAMANEKRLMILCQLVDSERSVGELAELLETRPSTISQHLALLRTDGLVEARRHAQTQYYSLAGKEARTVIETLYSLYCKQPKRKTRGKKTNTVNGR